ncbi:unnamed protein product [Mytilus coruscus]|uniref:Uncharacterized protein n=1 Tax=Mytilus coruscus TaxID=42192 RepID=A0A6J8DP63_MYTCO|nr:unnamed protein product [Mytilus coruscus]
MIWIGCDLVNGSCTSKEESTTPSQYFSPGNTSNTFLSTSQANYCLTTACVILIIALCYFVKKHKRNVIEKQQLVITDSENIRVNEQSNENNVMDDGINTYHVIDESQMFKSHDESNSANVYLNVLCSESDSVDDEDNNTDSNGYLHPYQLTREHLPRDFEGESNRNDYTEDGYLLPYNALLERRESVKHVYKKGVITTDVQESSSSTSSVPHTDIERYIHTNHQLQNMMERILHQCAISTEINIADERSKLFTIAMNSRSTQADDEAFNESMC